MKKTILILTAAASLTMHPIASRAGIVDDIDDIEQKIDDSDLDQSRAISDQTLMISSKRLKI
jgi:hypothetical protein